MAFALGRQGQFARSWLIEHAPRITSAFTTPPPDLIKVNTLPIFTKKYGAGTVNIARNKEPPPIGTKGYKHIPIHKDCTNGRNKQTKMKLNKN